MKKTFISFFLIALFLGGLTTSCSKEPTGSNFDLPDAPKNAQVSVNGTKALTSGEYRLEFVKQSDGYGLRLTDISETSSSTEETESDKTLLVNGTPATLNVRAPSATLLGTYEESSYSEAYDSVTKKNYGYLCISDVNTDAGSTVRIEDAYYVRESGMFALERRVEVLSAVSKDLGFQTVYSLEDPNACTDPSAYEYFIPAVIYKDSEGINTSAIGGNINVERLATMESKATLPMAMLRNKSNGYAVTLSHLDPEIGVGDGVGAGYTGEVNERFQYGSIGYTLKKGISVDYCYPASYGKGNISTSTAWTKVYHSMKQGTLQNYTLGIIPVAEETYAKSMVTSFKTAYNEEDPEINMSVDIDKIYDYAIELFDGTYQEFGSGDFKSAGVPWSVNISDATPTEYSFQMGFVGAQTAVGYHLLNASIASEDEELYQEGKTILDFWTSSSIMGGAVPVTWWDPNNNPTAGKARAYPSFLRGFVDGMESVMSAYLLMSKNGVEMPQWKDAFMKTADFLVNNQNSDGSFYRCYQTNGSVWTADGDEDYQGMAKTNTPMAVRFLAKIYEYTGEEKYKNAALNAAEFSYQEYYLKEEKYWGGTPDNANLVDKEAAMYAEYCFNAAYMLTKDAKYLEAAEHAAVSVMSHVYCYEFVVPGNSAVINPFSEGGVSGFSSISASHTSADNMASHMYYELFKLYLETGDGFYLSAAKLMQNNSKQSTDYDGRLGLKYRALTPEATPVSTFNYIGSGASQLWLPWCSIANIEPIQSMRLTFGNADIFDLTADRETLLVQLESYGLGGKA